MKKINISSDGSIKGAPKSLLEIQEDIGDFYLKSHNQTDCSGTNREDCTNAGDCTDATNNNVCSNTGQCFTSTTGGI